jgi:hypothetical protein
MASERCECHDCTQVRWKQSIQGQIESAMPPRRLTRQRTNLVQSVVHSMMGCTLTPEEAKEIIEQVRFCTHGEIECLK